MNLSTSSSSFRDSRNKLYRAIFRPMLICLFLLTLYQTLIWGGVLPASDGINPWQNNVIKTERYIYENKSDLKMVLVGSSLANRLRPEYFGSENIANIAMAGLASQTGLEIVKNTKNKPSIVLIELNDTIDRGIDSKLINYIYQPVLNLVRFYVSMFRQEYQPVSIFVSYIKRLKNQDDLEENEEEVSNPKLKEKLIQQAVARESEPLPASRKKIIINQVETIKAQIAALKKEGVRVILFDLPREERIVNTTRQKEIREMLRSLLPANTFEWLPEPTSKNWVTSDGLHLVKSSAIEYSLFIKAQVLKPV